MVIVEEIKNEYHKENTVARTNSETLVEKEEQNERDLKCNGNQKKLQKF